MTAVESPSDTTTFYESLVAELSVARMTGATAARSFGPEQPLQGDQLREWVAFQAWYEREAACFIGAWLRDVPEDDIFYGLTRQVADEGRHHHLFSRHLANLGWSLSDWRPEPEWVEWIQVFYPSGNDTIERVAAHNITGELGAIQAFESLYLRLPRETQKVIDRVTPDERFHVQLGRMTVERYATTDEAQARVRARVLRALELEKLGRIAFERRLGPD
jgi:hypothetical protein